MSAIRAVRKVLTSQPTIEGAGVHLERVFGYNQVPQLDPFLLLDDFHSDDPQEYLPGFPWHPHRGIETITYLLRGQVAHGDSLGNQGVISAGDVQWMTAGSGIVHQEMPSGAQNGALWSFQLWANLPAAHKMMQPRYRDIGSHDIPMARLAGGVTVRVICGAVQEVQGPVSDIVIDPEYLDVSVPARVSFTHDVNAGYTACAYVIEGSGRFGSPDRPAYREAMQGVDTGKLAIFDDGEQVIAWGGSEGLRFLLISGKPIGEPIAWQGPIVMNTQDELRLAFQEYRQGTFLKATHKQHNPEDFA